MATEQEVMKLVAELEDKYSVPMKQMQKAVRDMAHASKAANAEAGKAAREHSARLRELHERFAKVKDFASGALTPAFATMGITAFSAGAAINSLAESLKNAGERYRVLQDTVKRGGVSAQYVGVLSKTFEGLGIDGDKANDAVARLGETFDKLNRSTNSDERNRLTALFGNALPYLDSIVAGAKSREDAITRIAKAITDESVPIDIRRKLAEGVGLPPELASRSGAEFGKSFRRAVARELAHPTNMGLLEGLSKAFIHLNESLEDFNTDMVNTFGANGIKLIEGFATATEKMTGEVQHELNDLAAIFKAIRAVLDFDDKVSGAVQNFLGYKTNPFAQSMHGGLFAPSDDKDKIKEPVKQGVIEAFRQWMFENKVTDAEKFAGGYTPMAYHPDGGGTGPAFRSGGGYSVLNGGTVPKSAQGTVDKLAGSGDKTFDIGGSGAGEGAGGMPQWYIDRLKKSEGFRSKPYWDFKQWSVGYGTRASGPNDIVTKAEAERRLGMEVAKAASYVDKLNPHLDAGTRAALTDLAYNGGPGALKGLAGAIRAGDTDAIRERLAHGYYARAGGRPNAVLFNRRLMTSHWVNNPSLRESLALHGEALRKHFGHPHRITDESLLKHARESLLGPGRSGGHLGHLTASIDFANMPRGVRTKAAADGLFKSVKLNRGRPMTSASQDS